MTASNPRFTIAQLRDELCGLVNDLQPYAPPAQPSRYVRDEESRTGPVWDVPVSPGHDDRDRDWTAMRVRVIEVEPGAVFVEGHAFALPGDWYALTPTEARGLAMALLAGAEWAEGSDVLARRRLAQGRTP